MPKLSIITVNLNNATGLQKTIESVLNQSFSDYEYIIIDGGSTDGSVDVIMEYADKITYWASEPDKGIYNAMNKGVLRAKGEYLQILNSGDWLADNTILAKVFSYKSAADIIYGDLYINGTSHDNLHKFPEDISLRYLLNETIGHPSSFIKKSLFDKIGLYDEKYFIASDWKFFIEAIIINRCSISHLNLAIAVFSLNGISSDPQNRTKINLERENIADELLSPFQIDFPELNINYSNSLYAQLYNFVSAKNFLRRILRKILQLLIIFKNQINQLNSNVGLFLRNLRANLYLMNKRSIDSKDIPIIINNYNRLDALLNLINALVKHRYENIVIIDNNSTYPPLISYYEKCPYKVHRLDKNNGHLALWNTDLFEQYKSGYYVYTDPDVIPIEECPDDFLLYFIKILKKYPSVSKVGFSLKIDDLPDHFLKKKDVIKWESQNYDNKLEDGIFLSSIDTTFALYKPFIKGDWRCKAIRTGYPYEARHLPWYINDNDLPEEELYYRKTRKQEVSHWC